MEVVVHSADTGRLRIAETNSLQDDRGVETEAVEYDLEERISVYDDEKSGINERQARTKNTQFRTGS